MIIVVEAHLAAVDHRAVADLYLQIGFSRTLPGNPIEITHPEGIAVLVPHILA